MSFRAIIIRALAALLLCALAASAWAQEDGQSCLRLVWAAERALLEPLSPQNLAGRPFAVDAAKIAAESQGRLRLSLSCLEPAKVDPLVLKAAKGLRPGQISRPFELGGGLAMVQLTTMAHRRQGKKLFDQGRFDQAQAALEQDLALNPDSSQTMHLLGLCRVAAVDHAGAVTYFDRALELDPRNPAVLGDKASSLLALGRPKEAVDLYHQALALEADNPVVLNNLAWVLALEGRDLDRALAMALRAVELAPDTAALWVTLSEVQTAMGRHEEAKRSLDRAETLSPGAALAATATKAAHPAPAAPLVAAPTPPAAPPPTPDPARPAPAAPPAPATAAAAPAPSPGQSAAKAGYYLQVGSHNDLAQAQAQTRQWLTLGEPCLMEQWQSQELGLWHRVLLGPFASREAALAHAARLRAAGRLGRCLVLARGR